MVHRISCAFQSLRVRERAGVQRERGLDRLRRGRQERSKNSIRKVTFVPFFHSTLRRGDRNKTFHSEQKENLYYNLEQTDKHALHIMEQNLKD